MKSLDNKCWQLEVTSSSGQDDVYALREDQQITISNDFESDLFLNTIVREKWAIKIGNSDGNAELEIEEAGTNFPVDIKHRGGAEKPDLMESFSANEAVSLHDGTLVHIGRWMIKIIHVDEATAPNAFPNHNAEQSLDEDDWYDFDSQDRKLSGFDRLAMNTSSFFRNNGTTDDGSFKSRILSRFSSDERSHKSAYEPADYADDEEVIPRDLKMSTPIMRVMAVLLFTAGLALLIFNIPGFQSLGESQANSVDSVDLMLMESKYEGVSMTENSNGGNSVQGFVDTNKDLADLKSQVKSSGNIQEFNVSSNESLIESANDIFRVNDIKADVLATAPGVLDITAYDNNSAKVKMIEKEINSTLGLNKTITIKNRKPAVFEKNTKPSAPVFDDDKRITLLVAGDEGYVMTADESRYFVGSMLPSGHKITKITGSKVFIDKKGEKLTLNFN